MFGIVYGNHSRQEALLVSAPLLAMPLSLQTILLPTGTQFRYLNLADLLERGSEEAERHVKASPTETKK